MGRISPVEQYVLDEEADEIGGVITVLLGGQGAGKTVGLWNKAKIDIEAGRIVLWRGQETCQWIGLAANGLPVTIWLHSSIEEIQPHITGDIREGVGREDIADLEDAEDVDIRVKEFGEPRELVENIDVDRVNVYYIPGGKSSENKDRYFFFKKHAELAEALNNRSYGNHISYLMDEIGDVIAMEQRKPFYTLTEFKLPEEFGQFRKNNISFMGAGHDTSDIHYKFWKVKANTLIYMREATVKSIHSDIDQKKVNNFKRGDFVVPGFEKAHFEQPYMPEETISWLPESNARKLRMGVVARIPNIIPAEEEAESILDDSPLDKEMLREIVGVKDAADILGMTPQGVRHNISKDNLEAILVGNKYILSRQHVEGVRRSRQGSGG